MNSNSCLSYLKKKGENVGGELSIILTISKGWVMKLCWSLVVRFAPFKWGLFDHGACSEIASACVLVSKENMTIIGAPNRNSKSKISGAPPDMPKLKDASPFMNEDSDGGCDSYAWTSTTVGSLLRGKKVRYNSKTLIQTGISQDDKRHRLGFILKPRHNPNST
ncbi:hypothetical protein VNO78_15830 [Psophocarpus tetragonolobus]|uniref:Uncharacterized protein n=1 Tax=Psophocarpus tetragonolobus TaxID=3891 RepID=A0AAN9XK48_PSOTE